MNWCPAILPFGINIGFCLDEFPDDLAAFVIACSSMKRCVSIIVSGINIGFCLDEFPDDLAAFIIACG